MPEQLVFGTPGTVLDSDFDDLGGQLTASQLTDMAFELYVSADATTGDPERNRKHTGRPKGAKTKPRRDAACRCCIPYNGHHTPNYWDTGQKDIW